jgi:hypothetical protein
MAREEGSSEEARTYDDVREEQVARNTEKMKSLGLAVISSEMKALKKAAGKPKKKVMKNDLMFCVFVLFLYAETFVVIFISREL